MPLPEDTLVPSKGRAARWIEFDADWYRRTYLTGQDTDDLLADYLTQGQQLARSPNVFFDEAWYLRRYPDVADAVRAGRFRSGFDHYCRIDHQNRSPHWLFDTDFYKAGFTETEAGVLTDSGFINPYDHFLQAGSQAGRPGHPLFNPRYHGSQPADRTDANEGGLTSPYAQYLYRLSGKKGDITVSDYFDLDWYYAAYPEAKAAVDAGTYLCALHHYLCNDNPEKFNPLPDLFSETYYLQHYPDVAAAVANGVYRNGYMHFLMTGVFELRNPAPFVDLRYYSSHNNSVRRAVKSGSIRDAFVHVLTVGVRKGLMLASSQSSPDIPEEQTRALFLAQAQSLLPLYGRHPIDFSLSGPPICSVIMILNNGFHLSLLAISSLRQNHPGNIELILVDCGSEDGIRSVERYVTGNRLIRFEANIGFAKACNAALEAATSDAVLFLNSDARLAPEALSTALARLASDPQIGAVGGKVVRTNERLQEAGCIVWRDGSATGYLRDQSPACPESCFVRDVDFCSAVFLMVRAALFRQLGGFDDSIPAYLEDADLQMRMWEADYRVVYDPGVIVHHAEYGRSCNSQIAQTMSHRRYQLFFQKHKTSLRFHYAASPASVLFARAVDGGRRRVLFIEDTVPLRSLGAGYVRANDIIRLMASLDYSVTVFPLRSSEADPAAIYADIPDTVEVLYDRSIDGFSTFFDDRRGYYDCIWISRIHNLDLVQPVLERAALEPSRTRIVLDTEAVAAKRMVLQAQVLGRPQTDSLQDMLLKEIRNVHFCQTVLTVNDSEARLLAGLGIPDVRVLGTLGEISLTRRGWHQRSGMLFVGSLYGMDTPNYDSLCWFIDSILPLIESDLGYETRLTIAGYVAPDMRLGRFADHPRVTLLGPVSSLQPLYDRHRVVVAPTRFAAGTPYKVYEAASFGVPVVATTLLREQLGWQEGVELLSAEPGDPGAFASKVVALYRSEVLWGQLREAAALRLRRENGREAYLQTLGDVLPAHDRVP